MTLFVGLWMQRREAAAARRRRKKRKPSIVDSFTEEMATKASPAIEALIRQAMAGGKKTIDDDWPLTLRPVVSARPPEDWEHWTPWDGFKK